MKSKSLPIYHNQQHMEKASRRKFFSQTSEHHAPTSYTRVTTVHLINEKHKQNLHSRKL